MISRLKGPSFTEMEINIRGRYSKMSLMAKVSTHLRAGKYTKESSKMAGFKGKEPYHSVMAQNNTQVSGMRQKNMDSES